MTASTGAGDPKALADRGAGGRLGPLLTPFEPVRPVVARLVLMAFRVTNERQRADRERTGEILDQVDAWIAEGVLNGDQLHSADFAVASSLALVEYILALQPELRRRPLWGLLERVFSGRDAAGGRA
jgi:hypothetical protein